ncbi:flavin-containing monooxygenase [Streptomyces niveus]|uniref:flavin-containing monooxygenase n=1 Tax=Streptomyces niveus TaxID=193462 RepID=UPI0033C4279A
MRRTCVIGAGPSGLAASKVLASRNAPFDCFEAGSGVGGLWRYGNDNGMSGVYASLHTNISKRSMAFSSLALPDTCPVFPHHSLMLAYLEEYAASFGPHRHIEFGTRVTSVRPLDDGGWEVVCRRRGGPAEETRRYTEVVVANGHHWDPRLPSPAVPGAEEFAGTAIHSHDYRTPDPYAGQRVLVIGMGNSACEIAAEISRTAARTFLSARDAAHLFPKVLLGRPADHLAWSPLSDLPRLLKDPALRLLLRLTRGSTARYGLPEPVRGPLAGHPSTSDELLSQLARGAVTPKPGVRSFGRETAVFGDGSREQEDERPAPLALLWPPGRPDGWRTRRGRQLPHHGASAAALRRAPSVTLSRLPLTAVGGRRVERRMRTSRALMRRAPLPMSLGTLRLLMRPRHASLTGTYFPAALPQPALGEARLDGALGLGAPLPGQLCHLTLLRYRSECTLSVVHDTAFARGADLPELWLAALAELEAVVRDARE